MKREIDHRCGPRPKQIILRVIRQISREGSPSPANDLVGRVSREDNVGRDGKWQRQSRYHRWAPTGLCSPPPEEDHRSHPPHHAGGLLHRRTDENEGETKERVFT